MKRTTVLNFRTCLEKTSQINGIGFYVNTKIRRFRENYSLNPYLSFGSLAASTSSGLLTEVVCGAV